MFVSCRFHESLCVFVQVPPPDEEGRLAILKVHTQSMPLHDDVNLTELAHVLVKYTGAEIEGLCREAAIFALRENMKSTTVVCSVYKL